MRKIDRFQLRVLLKFHNYLYRKISNLAVKLNNGIHPKHKIMKYHEFFLENISENSKVLDIGCGFGAVSYDLAKKAEKVVAIDINKNNIAIAKKKYNSHNIEYICEDATIFKYEDEFDFIVLSNVLEHIKDRTKFLEKIRNLSKFILIRVPMIDRSWLTIYKKKMGIEYRLDPSHFIEYTLESFKSEMEEVNFKIISFSIQFGEIWAIVET